MGQVGILSERDRVELIDGEIVTKMTFGPRHCASVDRATRALMTKAGESVIVRVQGAVRLDLYSEPEPDLALLKPRSDFYASALPGPDDILLIIEVADSSIDYDRDVKALIYAHSSVQEYWVVDLNEDVVLCYSAPQDDNYQKLQRFGRGHSLTPRLLPNCAVSTNDLLGE